MEFSIKWLMGLYLNKELGEVYICILILPIEHGFSL